MDKVTIVIPAHNEEKRIGRTLTDYSNYFGFLKNRGDVDYEILVVINNTEDRTEEIVKIMQKSDNNIRYLNFKQGGKGFAVIEGFKEALKGDGNLIGFVDADNATSPEEYYKLILSIGNHHGVVADRYLRDSKIFPPVTLARLFARVVFNLLVRSLLLIPFSDTQCGAKVFRRKAIEKIIPSLSMSQWAFDAELLYNLRKEGFRIKAAPTVWVDKEYSKINFWRAGPWMALAVIRLRILNSPVKSFIKIYDRLIRIVPK